MIATRWVTSLAGTGFTPVGIIDLARPHTPLLLLYNPIIKAFGEQLLANGKTKMQVIGAAMRKLIHIIYGVLKHQQPFNENYLKNV